MKKLVAMGAMVALMLTAASPAFGQAVATDGGIATDDDVTTTSVQVVDASQFQSATQAQFGDATAVADDGSIAFASNGLFISQNQVNGGLGGFFFVY